MLLKVYCCYFLQAWLHPVRVLSLGPVMPKETTADAALRVLVLREGLTGLLLLMRSTHILTSHLPLSSFLTHAPEWNPSKKRVWDAAQWSLRYPPSDVRLYSRDDSTGSVHIAMLSVDVLTTMASAGKASPRLALYDTMCEVSVPSSCPSPA